MAARRDRTYPSDRNARVRFIIRVQQERNDEGGSDGGRLITLMANPQQLTISLALALLGLAARQQPPMPRIQVMH